jgi:hypothetical protein
MNPVTVIVDPMKASMCGGIAASHVITVIGKLLARPKARRLAHDLVAFDDQTGAIRVHHDPLSTQQRHRSLGGIMNGDEVNERVRLVGGQTCPSVMVTELVQ